jgi:hypothetical protein
LSFVALAAVMGWGASFVGLHAYGQGQMVGFSYWTAWLVPGTFDGAAFGATLITYRASIYGRSAMRGRMLMWSFTAISSWINWIHQVSPQAQIVAAGLPIAAVAVFDVVLAEMRADYEERHGKRRLRLRPGLLLLRWIVDRTGTGSAFRQQVTDIPVSEIAGLATQSSDERSGAHELDVFRTHHHDRTADEVAALEPTRSAEPAPSQPTPSANDEPPTDDVQTAVAQPSASHSGPPLPSRTPMASSAATQPSNQPAGDGTAPTEPTSALSLAAHSPTAQPSSSDAEQSPSTSEHFAEDTDADDEDARAEPTGTAAQAADAPTVMLPPVPASPLNELSDEDKRTFARRDYRLSLDTGSPLTGADLGRRYGYSERWGRRQIAAVRVEDREGEESGADQSSPVNDAENGVTSDDVSSGDATSSEERSAGEKRHLVALHD